MGNRRTVTTKLATDKNYLEKRRAHTARKKASGANTKVLTMERLLVKNKNMKKSSHTTQDGGKIAADVLAAAGISMQQDPKKTKKSFSLIKNVTSDMILRNPRIADITTYKNLPKNPVLVNSIIKNKDDPFYKLDAQKSDHAAQQRAEKAPQQPDLSMFVIEAFKKTTDNNSNTLRAFQGLRTGGR
jgi:hypothetical protein